MTLTRKISSAIVITVVVFSAANLFIVNRFLAETFDAYEDKEVSRNSSRVMQHIDASNVRKAVLDWSMWTETYDFVRGMNEGYVEANLDNVSLANIGINFVAFSTFDSDLVFARLVDFELQREVAYDETFFPSFVVNRNPVVGDGENVTTHGIIVTSMGPMYVASHPVLKDGRVGPPAGALIMGRLMNDSWRTEMMEQTRVEFQLHDVRTKELNAYQGEIIDRLRDGDSWVTKEEDLVRDHVLIRDIEGADALLVEIMTPRNITMQRKRVQVIGTGSVLASGLVILLVLIYALQRMVVAPLKGLTSHIASIDKTDDYRASDYTHKRDEIGLLARQFDALMLDYKAADENWRLPSLIAARSSHPIAFTDDRGVIEYANPVFRELLRTHSCDLAQPTLRDIFEMQGLRTDDFENMLAAVRANKPWTIEFASAAVSKPACETRILVTPVNSAEGDLTNISVYYSDITETKSLERQLMQAKKLESVGQLAAGVAHEINTPAQYVSDNIGFFKDSIDDINTLLSQVAQLSSEEGSQVSSDAIRSALEAADADYLQEEIPKAIAEAHDGIGRISKIVKAMKNFAHPGTELAPTNMNDAIESTVTIASNEWKYVAEMRLDLCEEMPTVKCNAGQINQVVLNIIINAAHALEEARGADTSQKGQISITTSHGNGWAEIRVTDTGPGMPESVRERLFDPFFTTKDVGKGTGQGLSIAYDVIVNKHGGSLDVISEPGEGACFVIRLPLDRQDEAA